MRFAGGRGRCGVHVWWVRCVVYDCMIINRVSVLRREALFARLAQVAQAKLCKAPTGIENCPRGPCEASLVGRLGFSFMCRFLLDHFAVMKSSILFFSSAGRPSVEYGASLICVKTS